MTKEVRWWKTYDYKTGHTYILGEKFAEKGQAMAYAKSCNMIILPQSTCAITDEEYRNAILENENKALREQLDVLKQVIDKTESEDSTNLCNQCANEQCVMQSGIYGYRNDCEFFVAKESEDKK